MSTTRGADSTDLRLLLALSESPRATTVALAERLGLSRNTVQARMTSLEKSGVFLPYERSIDRTSLGYPLTAFTTVWVEQRLLARIVGDLREIPEVVRAHGLSGAADLLVQIACSTPDELFRVDALILAIEGVERTETALSMHEVIPYRVTPLMRRDLESPT